MNPNKMQAAGFEHVQIASILGDAATAVALAGTTQAGATALTSDLNIATSGTGGVRLPQPSIVGQSLYFFNNSGATATVYPATGGKINGRCTRPFRICLKNLNVQAFGYTPPLMLITFLRWSLLG